MDLCLSLHLPFTGFAFERICRASFRRKLAWNSVKMDCNHCSRRTMTFMESTRAKAKFPPQSQRGRRHATIITSPSSTKSPIVAQELQLFSTIAWQYWCRQEQYPAPPAGGDGSALVKKLQHKFVITTLENNPFSFFFFVILQRFDICLDES